jgi:type III secretion system (T3SS) inner membrane Yop/YscD-like protein
MATDAPRYGWTTFARALEPHADARPRLALAAPQPLNSGENRAMPAPLEINRFPGLALPRDKTITISVIAGPSKGLRHQLTRPLISIGRSGAGADVQVDDPKVSGVHCIIGVKQEMIRLCDLESADGTYVNDERVQAAGLEHLSEFRIGSTWLVLTILSTTSQSFEAMPSS